MQSLGIIPNDIRELEDIVKLPFTTKNDLRDNYPFGLMALPMSEVVRIHASSGTTGKPTVVAYTRKDLAQWAECVSRCYTALVQPNKIFFKFRTVTDYLPVDLVLTMELKILELL